MAVATRWPLVGRRDELDAFAIAVEDPQRQAYCIYGPSGVGKTRLGEECLVRAEADDHRVLRATAGRSDRSVPLAAVAHLLPADAISAWSEGDHVGSTTRARMLDATVRTLSHGGPGRAVLLLDDAHRLDRSSLAVVDHLMTRGTVFCVVTVNSREPAPDTVTQWWREERGVRIDLDRLDAVGTDTLLHIVLEGPIDASATSALWRASDGNVLVLHELILDAIASGSLVGIDGVWRLVGRLDAPASVRDLVKARVDGLSREGRAVLELLALCQPVPLGQLESSFGFELLESLERDGLVAAVADGRRETMTLAHPLHGEVLRSELAPAVASSILLAQALQLEAWGARRRDDPVRIATWRLEATGQADPALLLRGAAVARLDSDWPTAVRLATVAFRAERTAAAGLLLGEALHHVGSFDDAERVFAAAATHATDAGVRVHVATARARNLFFGCCRSDDAEAALRSADLGPLTPAERSDLAAAEAELLAWSGRPLATLHLLDAMDPNNPRTRALTADARAAASAMVGRTAEAIAVSRGPRSGRGFDEPLDVTLPVTDRVTELFALIQAGQLAAAGARGRAWFDEATRARITTEVAWLALLMARGTILQGRARTALEWAARAAKVADRCRLAGLRPAVAALRAAALGLLGDAPASSHAADDVDRLPRGFGALAVELPLGRSWALVAAGDVAAARELLLAAAGDAESAGFVPAAAWLLHDAARLGAAGTAAPRLTALATRTDSELVHAEVEHASALAAGDADGLAAAAARFEALDARLLAAEAATAAAEVWRARDAGRAATLAARSAELAAQCEGARTPGLDRAGTTSNLSEREHDVAVLAASGLPSREIAESLSISVRTVDNHLGRIYAKLGVSSRVGLAAAIGSTRREDAQS